MKSPTEAELEILQIIWNKQKASVREVHEELSKRKEVGYTTTLKIMQIMHDKGILNRDTSARSHIYTAVAQKEKTQNSLLHNFINTAFKGSTKQLIVQALGTSQPSQEELDEIKELINKIENQ